MSSLIANQVKTNMCSISQLTATTLIITITAYSKQLFVILLTTKLTDRFILPFYSPTHLV